MQNSVNTKFNNLIYLKNDLSQSGIEIESGLLIISVVLESIFHFKNLHPDSLEKCNSLIFYHHKKKLETSNLIRISEASDDVIKFFKQDLNWFLNNPRVESNSLALKFQDGLESYLLQYSIQVKKLIVKLELEKKGINISHILNL